MKEHDQSCDWMFLIQVFDPFLIYASIILLVSTGPFRL